jgi:hypothetical protein
MWTLLEASTITARMKNLMTVTDTEATTARYRRVQFAARSSRLGLRALIS